MSKPPAFQLYSDDFLGGTCDMTQAEIGAYILLLCHQWNTGSTPVQPERQQLIARGPVSEHVISKFDLCPDGKLRNARLEEERQKQELYREKQRQAGIKSGEKRRTAVEPALNHGSTKPGTKREPKGNSPSPSPVSSIEEEREASAVSVEGDEQKIPAANQFTPPTVEQVKAFASTFATPDLAENFWNAKEQVGWVDRHGNPIRKWQPAFKSYVAAARANDHQRGRRAPQVQPGKTNFENF